jgi:uncharacterized membrane protein (UPF0127 family)
VTMLPGAVSWVATAVAISVLQLGVAASSAYQSANLTATTIAVGGISVTVEIADEPAERAHGLADRDGLAPGTGMIFVFSESGPRSFWMKGMRFCLDMVWIEQGISWEQRLTSVPPKGSQMPICQRTGLRRLCRTSWKCLPAGWTRMGSASARRLNTFPL